MRLEKHKEALKEVLDEIKASMEDPRGLLNHQRRLGLMLSLDVCELIEAYFHRLAIMKSGSRIKHNIFGKKDVKERLANQIIVPLDSVNHIGKILELAINIEESRDDIAYGSPFDEDKLLREKINQFLEMKKTVEKEIGDIFGPE